MRLRPNCLYTSSCNGVSFANSFHIDSVCVCRGVESGAPPFDEARVPLDKRKVVAPEQLWQVEYFLMTTFIDGEFRPSSFDHYIEGSMPVTMHTLHHPQLQAESVRRSMNPRGSQRLYNVRDHHPAQCAILTIDAVHLAQEDACRFSVKCYM